MDLTFGLPRAAALLLRRFAAFLGRFALAAFASGRQRKAAGTAAAALLLRRLTAAILGRLTAALLGRLAAATALLGRLAAATALASGRHAAGTAALLGRLTAALLGRLTAAFLGRLAAALLGRAAAAAWGTSLHEFEFFDFEKFTGRHFWVGFFLIYVQHFLQWCDEVKKKYFVSCYLL